MNNKTKTLSRFYSTSTNRILSIRNEYLIMDGERTTMTRVKNIYEKLHLYSMKTSTENFPLFCPNASYIYHPRALIIMHPQQYLFKTWI